MSERLRGGELADLVKRVFSPTGSDRTLAVLVDLPDSRIPDTPQWKERREMAVGWWKEFSRLKNQTGLEAHLVLYRNVQTNNADLPRTAWLHIQGKLPSSADDLDEAQSLPFSRIFEAHSILLAPTQFSATAPLKLAARTFGFRAATMPGFAPDMIPALRLDYKEINQRVSFLKDLLDRSIEATLLFLVDGKEKHQLTLDLRYRTAHVSSGSFPEPGTAGNLPSGEAYIVPYEGEREGQPSRSEGTLPVQLGNRVIVYRVQRNRAVSVEGVGGAEADRQEAELLAQEPAYGNLAELGLGVLSDFGLEPIGSNLLDEKLGLHIAFGRSDHFGGQVGAAWFSRPEAVVHQDRVYLPKIQPRIQVLSVDLLMEDGSTTALMRNDRYLIDFSKVGR